MNTDELGKLLLRWARRKRWWPVDSNQSARVADQILLNESNAGTVSTVLLQTQEPELLVQIPLLLVPESAGMDTSDPAGALIGKVDGFRVFDGTAEPVFWQSWVASATVVPRPNEDEDEARSQLAAAAGVVHPMGVEQSNTSVLFLGTTRPLIAKLFRVLHGGTHPEVELPRALGDWEGLPRLDAYRYLESNQLEDPACSAVVTDAVEDAEDGAVKLRAMCKNSADPASIAFEIGTLIGDMHNRLQQELGDGPGPMMSELEQRLEQTLGNTLTLSDALSEQDVARIRGLISEVTEDGPSESGEPRNPPRAIPVHGDLHLGQLLLGRDGRWKVVDFEGEPLRSLAERNLPDSPARDIAGMLRSFDYAAESSGAFDPEWLSTARQSFLDGYQTSRPISSADARMVRAYELEKALYEIQYESQFRPDWIHIPLNGVRRLLAP